MALRISIQTLAICHSHRRVAIYALIALTLLLAACETTVVDTNDELPVRCLDKPEPGPCHRFRYHYYYDYPSDRCKAFSYGGCGGRVPFETQQECEAICVAEPTNRAARPSESDAF